MLPLSPGILWSLIEPSWRISINIALVAGGARYGSSMTSTKGSSSMRRSSKISSRVIFLTSFSSPGTVDHLGAMMVSFSTGVVDAFKYRS